MYAAATGPGMASSSAASFGTKAVSRKTTPIQTPTRRDAMPVSSVMAMLVE